MYELLFSQNTNIHLFISRVDPRAKLLILLLFIVSVLILSVSDPVKYLILVVLLLMVILTSGLNTRPIVKGLIKIYPFILFVSFFQLLSGSESEQAYSGISFFSQNKEIWRIILVFQIETMMILASGIIFITSTPFVLLLKSLDRMRLPAWIVSVIFFSYRFVYILSHELYRLQIAYQSRYIYLPWRHRIPYQLKLMSSYLVRVFERNDQLYNALRSRGFSGTLFFEMPLSWKKTDSLIAVFASFLFIILNMI